MDLIIYCIWAASKRGQYSAGLSGDEINIKIKPITHPDQCILQFYLMLSFKTTAALNTKTHFYTRGMTDVGVFQVVKPPGLKNEAKKCRFQSYSTHKIQNLTWETLDFTS